MEEELLEELRAALENLETELVEKKAREILIAGIDPVKAVNYSLVQGMKTLSNAFDEGEIFVPHLLVAADAFEHAVTILTRRMSIQDRAKTLKGEILVYTVEGDIHDIGKNIVKTVLEASGFRVRDLGRNVTAEDVVKTATAFQSDMIIAFALMTTTLPIQKEIITILNDMGIREQFKVIVGGNLASKEWAQHIGADGYADSVSKVVEVADGLLEKKIVKTA